MTTNNCGACFNNSYWQNGMSAIATDENRNTNFAGNWTIYNNVEYDTSNPDSQLSLELTQMSKFIQGNNPQAAIIFFIQDFSQISMSQSQDGINEMTDQEQDLANVANAESQMKALFTSVENGSALDITATTKFLNGIKAISYHLKTDLWLAGLNSSVKSSLSQMTSLVNTETLGMIWQKANPYQNIVLQGTINSSTTTQNVMNITNHTESVDQVTLTNINPDFWYYYTKSQKLNMTNDKGLLSTVLKMASIPATALPAFDVYADMTYNPTSQTLTISFDKQNLNISNGTAFYEATHFYNVFATTFANDGLSDTGVPNLDSLINEAIKYNNSLIPPNPNPNRILEPQMQDLQTMLTGFDTLNSATGTLTNQYQSQAQYQAGAYQEKGSFVSEIQNDVVQANNSINSNIQPAA